MLEIWDNDGFGSIRAVATSFRRRVPRGVCTQTSEPRTPEAVRRGALAPFVIRESLAQPEARDLVPSLGSRAFRALAGSAVEPAPVSSVVTPQRCGPLPRGLCRVVCVGTSRPPRVCVCGKTKKN